MVTDYKHPLYHPDKRVVLMDDAAGLADLFTAFEDFSVQELFEQLRLLRHD